MSRGGKKVSNCRLPDAAKSFQSFTAEGTGREKVIRKLTIESWRIEDFKKNRNLSRKEVLDPVIGSFRLEPGGDRTRLENYL